MFVNDLSPVMLELGPVEIRWYGAMFALGILGYYLLTVWAFKREKSPLKDFDSLVIYLFLGLVIGARLGHVFFYQAEYYLSNPLEILKIWNGGLASHGAAIGIFVAVLIWSKVKKIKFSKYADVLCLGVPLTAGFVRVGNFFNSEIVGRPTESEWGVVFARLGEDFPRHPSQFYEAGLAWLVFAVMMFVYLKWGKKLPKMFMFFLLLGLYFATRFGVEFFKERHLLSLEFPLSMGQILSIVPIFAAMIYFVVYLPTRKR